MPTAVAAPLPRRLDGAPRSIAMMIAVISLALVTQLTVAIADDVPNFNVEPVCRGISQQGGLSLEPNKSVRQDYDSCIKSEMAAREQLVNQWSTFKASDKANCIGASSAGGLASYSGLLTCLQMAAAANKLGQ
jgi:hypothetical protein